MSTGPKGTVTLTFAGDSKGVERATQSTVHALDTVDAHAKQVSHSTAELGEKFEGATKHIRGGRDVLDGASTAFGAMGAAIPGPIGNVLALGMGMADLADGIGTTVVPMLGKLRLAQISTFGYVAIAVVAIAALAAGFIYAYKHSEKFRNAIHALGQVAKDVFAGIKTAAVEMGKVFVKVGETLLLPYKLAFNGIAAAWNNTVGRLSFSVPGWVPGIGGNGFSVPHIPTFASGGRAPGGMATVGERGPENVFLPAGARVVPAQQSTSGGGGRVAVDVTVRSSDGQVLAQVRKLVRTEGGGNVQMALGRT